MKKQIAGALVCTLLLELTAIGMNPFEQIGPFFLQDCAEMVCRDLDATWTSYAARQSVSSAVGYRMIAGVLDCPRGRWFASPGHLEIAEYDFWQRGNEMCCELTRYIYCTIY